MSHRCMSHVTWVTWIVISRVTQVYQVVLYICVTWCTYLRDVFLSSHIWVSHVTHMNEPCHTCDWVMSHKCMNHVTCVTWIVMSHVTRVDQIVLYTCVTRPIHLCDIFLSSHIWMSHVTYMNESCHVYRWVASHIWMSHVTDIKETFICVPWRIPMSWTTAYFCVTWLVHLREMTDSYNPR